MQHLLLLYIVLMCSMHSVISEKNEIKFVPTHEWQEVKKGQPIPSGLHVRYNFETGIVEAKLLSDDKEGTDNENVESLESSLVLHPDANATEESVISPNESSNNNLKMSMGELKNKLKNIKNENKDNEKLENKFRSYKELKDELKGLELNITTDSEILKNLFNEFKSYKQAIVDGRLEKDEIDAIGRIFNDLEYLSHQVDNAQIFADMDGMAEIISPSLNATNNEVKMGALLVFGSCVQSNPKVQLKALNSNLVRKLLHLLTSANDNVLLSSRCLFALSALVRQFPMAQKTLVDHGGLEIFSKILQDGQMQVQMRVMKLISDLLIERKDIKTTGDAVLRERRNREYQISDLERKLVVHKYCESLSDAIQSLKHPIDFSMEMYDFLDAAVENMLNLTNICKQKFRNANDSLLKVINFWMDQNNLDVEILENFEKQLAKLRTLTLGDKRDEL